MSENKGGAAFDFKLIRRMVRLASPYKLNFYTSIFLTLILTAIAPLRPWLVQQTLDTYIPNKDIQGLSLMAALILGHILFQTLILYIHTYLTNLLGQNVIKDLRMRVYEHILSMRKKFFDHSKVGTLVTRSVTDIETIANFFGQGFISVIGELAQLLVILVVMFWTDWELTLISLSVFPVLLIASEFFRRGVRKSFQDVRTQISRLNAFVQEHIVGMDVVQIFGKQDQEYEKFRDINRSHLEAYKKSIFYYAVYFPIVEILSSVAIGLIIWWSARTIGSGASPGMIVAFYMYISMIFRPIRTIADRFNTMQMGMVSSERIFKLLDEHKEQENRGTLTPLLRGSIRFDHVWFAYNDDEWVLKDLSLEVEQGKSLAIVGATGAGKSSIINLISRLYDIQKGEIYMDNIPIRDIELKHLRNQIAVVLQDVFLFAGTVKENIQLKNDGISDERMVGAAREIGAMQFIESLPGGWEYDVKERGSSLSVGQRQLISFIRALAYDPKVLILDEATSSVDSETEELIRDATRKLMKNRTSIVIAHRLSTIREADHIVVLDRGKIIEQGSHSELLENKLHYYELHQKQFELT